MSGRRRCCLCGASELSELIRLDHLPISHYLRRSQSDPDPRFSVEFLVCRSCGLLQIVDPIPAELLYGEADTYTTGFQRPRHLDDLITTAIGRQDPGKAIDVGCNDGALLEALIKAGYAKVVGVEPNAIAAGLARDKGHFVYTSYLDETLASRIVAEHGAFDTVYLRHVAEHVSDLAGFFVSLRSLLRPNGLLVLELPEVEESFALGSPAILWEEHVNYFTQSLAEFMLNRFGFKVLDRRRYVFGGGSMAFVAQKQDLPADGEPARPDPAPVIKLLRHFTERMDRQKSALRSLVVEAGARGFQVVMYGAAPRSCLVASVCGIGDRIDFVLDDREDIQDRLMPGTQRVVRPLTAFAREASDRILCLLGVGAENEFKVRAKIEGATGARPVFVSLFPPRDTLQSVDQARHAIAAHQ
ncbi:MAG: methyltransferase domain-containing protein [Pseudomonadota bacterium]